MSSATTTTRPTDGIRDYARRGLARRARGRAREAPSGTPSIALNLGTGTGFSVLEVSSPEKVNVADPAERRAAPRGRPAAPDQRRHARRKILGWKAERAAIEDILGTRGASCART
jgi:UDP-glucose 4-epimerase